jgi:hypothetical protein
MEEEEFTGVKILRSENKGKNKAEVSSIYFSLTN